VRGYVRIADRGRDLDSRSGFAPGRHELQRLIHQQRVSCEAKFKVVGSG
jgi:hypothetical protein